MPSDDNKSAIFFRVGSIGYIAGFIAWFTWFFPVIANWVAYKLGFGYFGGIFIQSGLYFLIVYGLFSASFMLGSFACFGLKKRYGSNIALICGVLYIVIFAILCYSLVEVYFLHNYIPILIYTSISMNLGLLIWGITLLEVRKSIPHSKLILWIGGSFILIAVLTLTLFWQLILYWGMELWFMLFGWLYAIDAVATAILLLRLSK